MKMKNILQITGIAVLLLLIGCSKELERENSAPVLVRILTDISVPVNGYVTITMKQIEGYDDNGDEMSIVALAGENYTLDGVTVTPTTDFIGDLFVPVYLTDGELSSRTDTIIVSVVNEVVSLPLFTGAWWEYNDTVMAEQRVLTSRMEVGDSTVRTIGGKDISAFDITWTNLDRYGVTYLMSNDSAGSNLHGGFSSNDTILSEQRFYRFPVDEGDSWSYSPLKYNATDSVFIEHDENTVITCTNSSAYIKVPAGTFHCVELTSTYIATMNPNSKTSNLFLGTESSSDDVEVQITEKIYYSAGVGTVKTLIYTNGNLAWNKVLTDYYVIEEIF